MQISSPRILVVDDEPNVLLTLETILTQEGYSVEGLQRRRMRRWRAGARRYP